MKVSGEQPIRKQTLWSNMAELTHNEVHIWSPLSAGGASIKQVAWKGITMCIVLGDTLVKWKVWALQLKKD